MTIPVLADIRTAIPMAAKHTNAMLKSLSPSTTKLTKRVGIEALRVDVDAPMESRQKQQLRGPEYRIGRKSARPFLTVVTRRLHKRALFIRLFWPQ